MNEKNSGLKLLHRKISVLSLPETIQAEFDDSSEGSSLGSLKRQILFVSLQVAKDPMFVCVFDFTTNTGNVS